MNMAGTQSQRRETQEIYDQNDSNVESETKRSQTCIAKAASAVKNQKEI